MSRKLNMTWSLQYSFCTHSYIKEGDDLNCIIEPNAEVSFRSPIWRLFIDSWFAKIHTLEVLSVESSFRDQVVNWVAWEKQHSIVKDVRSFDQPIETLSNESITVLTAIVKLHTSQFQALSTNCKDYDDFVCLMNFIENMPHRFKEAIEKLYQKDTSNRVMFEDEIILPSDTRQNIGKFDIDWQEEHCVTPKLDVDLSKSTSNFF